MWHYSREELYYLIFMQSLLLRYNDENNRESKAEGRGFSSEGVKRKGLINEKIPEPSKPLGI